MELLGLLKGPGFPIVGGAGVRGASPPSPDFFNPLTKADAPHGVPPHLKMKPPWKSKAPFHEISPRKKPKK